MARRLVAAALVVVLAGCATRRPRPDEASPVVVAHLGDSTVSTPYLPPAVRVDALLNARLRAHYRQPVVNLNLARAGERVSQVLAAARWAALRTQAPHIDVALVRYGHNDMAQRSPDAFGADLEALCDRLEREYPGVHLVLETNTFIDPAHGGSVHRNARYERYWEIVRRVARRRGLPVVDLAARRRREAAAGNWDLNARNRVLALQRFGRPVSDDAHDAEMAGVPGWFGDTHPNARGVALAAEEELRTLAATWPDGLPRARGQSPYLSIFR